MGRAKNLHMDEQNSHQIIDTIYDYLKNGVSPLVNNIHFKTLKMLSDEIDSAFIRDIISEELERYAEYINNNGVNDIEPEFVASLLNTLDLLKYKFNLPEHFNNRNSINSENYYNNKIQELTVREKELRQQLISNENTTEEQRRITKETEEKLKEIENQLEQKKKELERKQKQEDAKSDWENKINSTFELLKEYLSPIKTEHSRLNILYYVFAGLTSFTILIIIIIEIIAITKIWNAEQFPGLQKYLLIFLPLPIAGALMWGFVYQMNRAQRQLLLLANNIHNINYIQGLLISINNLSPDINNGIVRVNSALDKIISNHLNNQHISNETELLNEERKDSVDIDKILKILKAAKETSK